jgi:hypothetical protein
MSRFSGGTAMAGASGEYRLDATEVSDLTITYDY